MSISSNDINMLLKPTTKTTLLGGSRLMSNFKSTGYKINGGEGDEKDKKATTEQKKETPKDAEPTKEAKPAEEQKETQKDTEQKTQATNKPSTVKKIFDNVLFYGFYGSLWMKDKSNVIKGGTQPTQEHQEGGGIIKDSLIIAAKIVLVFFMVIFISILIEEIVKMIKKYGPELKQYNVSSKCDGKKNKKGKKIKKQRRLIIAPIPCSEYVNTLNNQIKTQQQMQQAQAQEQGIPQIPQIQQAIQQTQQGAPQQGITQTQQQIQQQMQQQVQEQVQQEQNLLQEASMINPLNSALRDDDLFRDRIELQGVRNIPVNTSDFL